MNADENDPLYTPLTDEEIAEALESGFISTDTVATDSANNGCGVGPGLRINRFVRIAAKRAVSDAPIRPNVSLAILSASVRDVLQAPTPPELWERVRGFLLNSELTNMDRRAVDSASLRSFPPGQLRKLLTTILADLGGGIEPIVVNHNVTEWNGENPNAPRPNGGFVRNVPRVAVPGPGLPDRRFTVVYDVWSDFPTDRPIGETSQSNL